jgi:hypothetical protein
LEIVQNLVRVVNPAIVFIEHDDAVVGEGSDQYHYCYGGPERESYLPIYHGLDGHHTSIWVGRRSKDVPADPLLNALSRDFDTFEQKIRAVRKTGKRSRMLPASA